MISRRNLLNLVLLITVLVLVAIVAITPEQPTQPASIPLTNLQQAQVEHIMIQRSSGENIELHKVHDQWWMETPYALPANAFRMQSLLRLVDTPSLSQNNLDDLDLNTFGLAQPRATITFNEQVTIQFGDNEPLQQHRYVKVNNTLHLINDTFYYQLAARATTFLDHRLLAANQAIRKLVLPGLVIELQDGKWHSTPTDNSLSADAISDLVSEWRTTQAIEITPSAHSKAQQHISIYLKGSEQPVVFHVSKNEDKITLIRNDLGLGYVITEDKLHTLLSPATAHKQSD